MKIKLIVFDLDGVLVESKNLHYEALNWALKKINSDRYQITYVDHVNRFDGLPTKIKLKILLKEKKISKKEIPQIINLKNLFTIKNITKTKTAKINTQVIKKLS